MKNTTTLLAMAVLLAACAGQADLPTVTTDEVTGITYNSATVNATVTDDGGAPIEARGVCYSTSPQPSLDNGTCTSNDRGTGSFSAEINNLSTNTTYYTRAYATNSEGTAYGNEVSFATAVLISTLDCNGATLNGTLVSYVVYNGSSLIVPYTGGNGGLHNGQTVTSTGVTGLTATLSAGQFANGSGSLSYQITGTPNGTGTASFALDIVGQQCTVDLPVGNLGCQGGLCIGQQYQGGILAYFLQPGDIGYDANTPHGIIVAPTDQSTGAEWGCWNTTIGGTQSGIGYGAANTTAIVNGCAEAGIAAKICEDLVLNGYSDWYLPSIDELEQLYVNLYANGIGSFNSIGSFNTAYYWSSTEVHAGSAWRFVFGDGNAYFSANKSGTYYVRAVRSF